MKAKDGPDDPAALAAIKKAGADPQTSDAGKVWSISFPRHAKVEDVVPGIKQLKGLPDLRQVFLWEIDLSNDDLAPLLEIPKLDTLGLGSNRLTDDGMKTVAKIANLQAL